MAASEPKVARVTLNIFSGLRNPSWSISREKVQEFNRLLENLPENTKRDKRPYEAFSFYAGYTIEAPGLGTLTVFNGEVVLEPEQDDRVDAKVRDARVLRIDDKRELEAWLFREMPRQLVRDLGQDSFELLSAPRNENKVMDGVNGSAAGFDCANAPPYPGPNGVWKKRAKRNNCYNYANDEPSTGLLSAMPGGLNVTSFTPATLRAAVVSDGLIDLGVSLPTMCPVPHNAHFVAICLREKFGIFHDFHCWRLDADGGWSHKDGNGAVRNTDNYGAVITDLATARWKLSSSLVGFFISIDGQRNIRA